MAATKTCTMQTVDVVILVVSHNIDKIKICNYYLEKKLADIQDMHTRYF